MNSNQNQITSSQLITFIMSVQIGIGILTLPAALADKAGHDGWISILITWIIFCIAGIIMVFLLSRYNNKSILEINLLLYTKGIGYIFNLFIIGYLFFASAIGLRLFTEVIDASVLKLTPEIIIAILLLLPSIHMSWYGLKTICRFDRIIILILSILLLFLLLFFDKMRLTFLMPIGQAGYKAIINSILPTSFAFLGIELLVIVYPSITDKSKLMRSILMANSATAFFYIMTTVVLTGIFGEALLKHLLFPLFSLSRIYKAPVLERLDLFFIAIWLPAMGISMTAYYYCTLSCLEKLVRYKKRFLLHISFSCAVVLASRIPRDLSNAFEFAEIFSMVGIGIIGLFAFSLIFSYINKSGVVKK